MRFVVAVVCFCSFVVDPQWGTVDAEIKVSSAENPERLNVLPLKPGEAQNIHMPTSPTTRTFFLSDSYTTSGPIKIFFCFVLFVCFFVCFFSKPLPRFFLAVGVAGANQPLLIRLRSCFRAC